MITIDEFKKLEMRVGTITVAEKVPDTDKLLQLSVDFGEEEPRTIVSGIASYVTPEDLIGKQYLFAANLEPRMIRGIESQGMILAIGGNDDAHPFALLAPTTTVASGERVK